VEYATEKPDREVDLPAYSIGQYPVTNRQYAAFIKREWRQKVRVWCRPAHTQKALACTTVQMRGNVQEWTSTLWGSDTRENAFPYPYCADDCREDLEAEQRLSVVYRVHRGGSYRDERSTVRCSARGYASPTSKIGWRGFRVVLDV
jgi:formylglycine-generating enzyme required for sulfatase activity